MTRAVAFGGTWDNQGGRESRLFQQFVQGFVNRPDSVVDSPVEVFNGGHLNTLRAEVGYLSSPSVLIWMPDIPNEEDKIVESLKASFPRTILIGSKRLDGRDLELPDVIDRMLHTKMNLCVLLDRDSEDRFQARLLDPLGNLFFRGDDFRMLGTVAGERTEVLRSARRVQSVSIGPTIYPDEYNFEFGGVVREYAEQFDHLIPRPKQVSRFLGNSAFRCSHGFPAFKGNNGLIYVSQRNIEKRDIGPKGFVPVQPYRPYTSKVFYYGCAKPSVDTAVNLLLFQHFPKINYLIHGHVYTTGPFTQSCVPCGALEEFDEILGALKDRIPSECSAFTVNLKGHGCIIAGASVKDLRGVAFSARPLEERH